MAVRLESKVKHFLADTATDELPRVGAMFEGVVLTLADLPVGSTVLFRDTGKLTRWNGLDWAEAVEVSDEACQPAILAELREIKTMIALKLA